VGLPVKVTDPEPELFALVVSVSEVLLVIVAMTYVPVGGVVPPENVTAWPGTNWVKKLVEVPVTVEEPLVVATVPLPVTLLPMAKTMYGTPA
jgi:hypothetical protein